MIYICVEVYIYMAIISPKIAIQNYLVIYFRSCIVRDIDMADMF